ncbi:MAG: hypothetical protein LWW86_15955 [Micrococcales bacterium]|nr:hypothetical protein [Micrococcales bacterium]
MSAVIDVWIEFQNAWEDVVDAFNTGLDFLRWLGLDGLADDAANAWDTTVQPQADRVFGMMPSDQLAYGSPLALLDRVDLWTVYVAEPCNRGAGVLDSMGSLSADHTWVGSAADAYAERAGRQLEAVQAMAQDIAFPVSEALRELANEISSFQDGIRGGVLAAIGTLVLVVVEAASGVGMLWVVATLAVALGLLGDVMANNFARITEAGESAAAAFDQVRSNAGVYPYTNGQWPAGAVI